MNAQLHPNVKDLRGKTFGRLTVLEPVGRSNQRQVIWKSICACGQFSVTPSTNLLSGDTRSCGCLNREIARKAGDRTRTHGLAGTTTYAIWSSMRDRCTKPHRKDYPRYGGRGISVCDRWMSSFDAFLSDMGIRPSGMSIDRIDTNGNYEPSNCRWATLKEQARNHSRNHNVTIGGVSKCIAQWIEEFGISSGTVSSRMQRGWPPEKALTTPVDARFNWRASK